MNSPTSAENLTIKLGCVGFQQGARAAESTFLTFTRELPLLQNTNRCSAVSVGEKPAAEPHPRQQRLRALNRLQRTAPPCLQTQFSLCLIWVNLTSVPVYLSKAKANNAPVSQTDCSYLSTRTPCLQKQNINLFQTVVHQYLQMAEIHRVTIYMRRKHFQKPYCMKTNACMLELINSFILIAVRNSFRN